MYVVRDHYFLINMALTFQRTLVILVAAKPCDIAGDVQLAHAG